MSTGTTHETAEEVWADVRLRWNRDDLPVLLGTVGDHVLRRVERRMKARRWSVEDEG